jgi:DNA uptake protein ComE-like DNA-binding protein
MKLRRASKEARASVLIIVLWVAFGLVSVALYFAHSMTFELRASDNRVAGLEAEQAIEGAARYLSYLLANAEQPGKMPDLQPYERAAMPVGAATVWLIGRETNALPNGVSQPVFGLVDEASKLNLNTATLEMLESLPRMTPELAAAIIDWRDSDSEVTAGGAEDEIYLRLNPAYKCKNGPFETVDELRLVFGADLDILYGEDSNLNGVLDPNENDGNVSPPTDNRDGRLDPGILAYMTIYSREPNTRTNVNNPQQLAVLLQATLSTERVNQILSRTSTGSAPGGGRGGGGAGGAGGGSLSSVLEFYVRSGMTAEEFAPIERSLTATNSAFIDGLINVNTASEAVLACIPGIGTDKAASLVAYRQSNPDKLNSVAWVSEVLDQASARQAGPFLTGQSYQFSADIAAVGHHGRGYRRVRFVLDTTEDTPKILYRQDLSHLGWALGKNVRQTLLLARKTP